MLSNLPKFTELVLLELGLEHNFFLPAYSVFQFTLSAQLSVLYNSSDKQLSTYCMSHKVSSYRDAKTNMCHACKPLGKIDLNFFKKAI